MGQKTDNKVMKQMHSLWNQQHNREQALSDKNLSDDERTARAIKAKKVQSGWKETDDWDDDKINKAYDMLKEKLNEIGDTEKGQYALGQVAGRAYDRMLNGKKKSVGDGVVALDPKYGKVAQDAAYAGAGGYIQWEKKFKEKHGRKPTDDERHKFMQNHHNGCHDYGKPESERKGVVKVNESQLRKVIAECVKSVLTEDAYYDGRYGESRIPSSYIGDAMGQIDMVRHRLSNLTDHVYSICNGMSDEEYAYGYMDSSSKTIDVLRKIWPLLKELCEIWGYRNS